LCHMPSIAQTGQQTSSIQAFGRVSTCTETCTTLVKYPDIS
jgi:hypothetical protein